MANIVYDNYPEDESEASTIINDDISLKEEDHDAVTEETRHRNIETIRSLGYNSRQYVQTDRIYSSNQQDNEKDEDTSHQGTVLKLRIAGKHPPKY